MTASTSETGSELAGLLGWLAELRAIGEWCRAYAPDEVSGDAADWTQISELDVAPEQLSLIDVADDGAAVIAGDVAQTLRHIERFSGPLALAVDDAAFRSRFLPQLLNIGTTPAQLLTAALTEARSCGQFVSESWNWEAKRLVRRAEEILTGIEALNTPLEDRERLVEQMRQLGRAEVTLDRMVTVIDTSSGEACRFALISGALRRGPNGLDYIVPPPAFAPCVVRTDAPLGSAIVGRFVEDVLTISAPAGIVTYRVGAVEPLDQVGS